MSEKATGRRADRPVAFLPWVDPDKTGAAERAVSELTEHVAEPEYADADDAERAEPEIEEPDPEQIADRIVRGLSRKSLSIAEVEERLYKEGVPEVEAGEIVERFQRFGYLDDLRMAEQLVTSLRERKKLGRSAIAGELRARKLDPECIQAALDELDGDDEYTVALELARKRLPSLRSLSDEVAERRLSGFLARRGYAGATIQKVVRATVRKPGSSVRFR